MTISIIIAVKTWQKNLEDCVNKCRELDYPEYEIIILPDEPFRDCFLKVQGQSPNKDPIADSGTVPVCDLVEVVTEAGGTVPIKVVPTGAVSPGAKRDIGLKYAKGEILAFLDDDAYPIKDWLKNAVRNFSDLQVAAVGGPAITPPNDDFRQKASGLVYSSILVSGNFTYRYIPGKRQEVDDFPSCNFLVRKSVMEELGGFNTNFWPGEDTKLCLDITKKLKKKIIYDPEALVYHHRRSLFLPHLKQIKSYALHRGYFVKRYPETSLKISYFIPSIFFIIVFIGSIASLALDPLREVYFFIISIYIITVFIFSINKKPRFIPIVCMGIILTHQCYGIYFLKGLMVRKLKEES